MAGKQMFWSKSKENDLYTRDRREGNREKREPEYFKHLQLASKELGKTRWELLGAKVRTVSVNMGAAPVTQPQVPRAEGRWGPAVSAELGPNSWKTILAETGNSRRVIDRTSRCQGRSRNHSGIRT